MPEAPKKGDFGKVEREVPAHKKFALKMLQKARREPVCEKTKCHLREPRQTFRTEIQMAKKWQGKLETSTYRQSEHWRLSSESELSTV